MERNQVSDRFPLGSLLPSFSLPSTTGEFVGDGYLHEGKAGLVVFGCNHCPYVKGSEEMLIALVRRYEPQGLRTVVISSNDAAQYPDDSFDAMKEKALRMKLPYYYLYDETQQVARQFDAACTPELYLFDRDGRLVYHGAINDSPRDPSKVTKEYLSSAIEAVLNGEAPAIGFAHPIGCSIKWKKETA